MFTVGALWFMNDTKGKKRSTFFKGFYVMNSLREHTLKTKVAFEEAH